MRVEQATWSAQTGWEASASSTGLGGSAQLVLTFGGPGELEASDGLHRLHSMYPNAHIIGCTTAGEIQGMSYRENSVVITAVALDHAEVASARVIVPRPDAGREAGARLIRELPSAGLHHVMVFAEGLSINGSDLLAGINATLPPGVSMSGGFAGDGDRLQETRVWCDSEPVGSAAVAVGFYGDRLRVAAAAEAGFDPLGPDRLITRSDENVLYELDGQPALSLYKRYLGAHAEQLPAAGLLFPFGVRSEPGETMVMRALLGVDEAEQSITFAGNVPEGSQCRMMMGRIEHLIDGARGAAGTASRALGETSAELAILVSCNGRRPVLKQRLEEELEAVSEAVGKGAAMTGFYSYGEIAPLVGGTASVLHNETMTVTAFAER